MGVARGFGVVVIMHLKYEFPLPLQNAGHHLKYASVFSQKNEARSNHTHVHHVRVWPRKTRVSERGRCGKSRGRWRWGWGWRVRLEWASVDVVHNDVVVPVGRRKDLQSL